MHWFKIHHGFSSDSKLALVAHKLGESRATINGIFIDILEYASKQEDRGSIVGYNVEAAALAMGVSDEFMHDVIVTLRNVTIVTHEKVVNWDKYQGSSDSTNAERQRRYREKKKQELSNDVTHSNVTCNVTSPLRNTDKNREEKKESPIVPKVNFDEFWEVCPKKVGKKDAKKSYDKALLETSHEKLMDGMRRYAESRRDQDAKYTQAPAAWLNKGRWHDDYGSAKSRAEIPGWIKAQYGGGNG